ncbi:VOC family protein [Streptomyces sp. NPDC092370]|uniref:VOC family protein n=1 Tax=Streptomyces sp. NPDC092370 TaxID=3366016 RepID=UPI00382D6D0D
MAVSWDQLIVDAADHTGLGRWWARALGWVVVVDTGEEFEIRQDPRRFPGILFTPVGDGKIVKNRLHLDLRPDDQASEVTRLVALGARHVDIGQRDEPWVVLADPEGNEFCVLGSRKN